MQAADWKEPGAHQTRIVSSTANRLKLRRTLDADEYFLELVWDGGGRRVVEDEHSFLLTAQDSTAGSGRLEFVAAFSPGSFSKSLPGVQSTFVASADHWRRFWTEGGAVELGR